VFGKRIGVKACVPPLATRRRDAPSARCVCGPSAAWRYRCVWLG